MVFNRIFQCYKNLIFKNESINFSFVTNIWNARSRLLVLINEYVSQFEIILPILLKNSKYHFLKIHEIYWKFSYKSFSEYHFHLQPRKWIFRRNCTLFFGLGERCLPRTFHSKFLSGQQKPVKGTDCFPTLSSLPEILWGCYQKNLKFMEKSRTINIYICPSNDLFIKSLKMVVLPETRLKNPI